MRLAKERDRRGLTYVDMGCALGIGAVHFERLERGMATPKFALLEAWAAKLGFGVEIGLVERKDSRQHE
jgi:transcriptional regulator with XRE-family HTH domain